MKTGINNINEITWPKLQDTKATANDRHIGRVLDKNDGPTEHKWSPTDIR